MSCRVRQGVVKELKQNDNSFIGEDFIRTANALENDGLELSEEVRRMKEERFAKKEAKEETQTKGKVKVAVLDFGERVIILSGQQNN